MVGFSILGLIDSPGKIEGGEVVFDGQDLVKAGEARLREVRGREISMVFQDPMTSLNPLHRIGAQIGETLGEHTALSKAAIRARTIDLLRQIQNSVQANVTNTYQHAIGNTQPNRRCQRIALERSRHCCGRNTKAAS